MVFWIFLVTVIFITDSFDHSQLYTFANVDVAIMFSTITVLQLCKSFCSSLVDLPKHIMCNVGEMDLYSELLIGMMYSSKFASLVSLTLLVPSEYHGNQTS
jgi:hypothetical protein